MNLFKRYAKILVVRARHALKDNQCSYSKRMAKKALSLDASLEEAWLIMAACSEPEESIAYLLKVLQLDPQNVKAIKGLDWARSKIKDEPKQGPVTVPFIGKKFDLINGNGIHQNKIKTYSKRFFSRWQTVLAVVCVLTIILIAAAAPLLAPVTSLEDPLWFKVICERHSCIPEPPSGLSILGTVKEFDVYHTLIWGTRQALVFGVLTASITALIGTLLGLISGYFGGWIDKAIMRICDAFMAFPIVAGVALFAQLAALLEASRTNFVSSLVVSDPRSIFFFKTLPLQIDPVLFALILFSWMGYTRIIHSQVLIVKKEEYIEAAYSCGARPHHIIFKHILPNSITPAVVMVTRDIGRMVVLQSSLTFIGVGDSSAWSTILSMGKDWIIGPGGNLFTRWWIFLPITMALVFFGFTWGIIGDELNYWMNPRNA